MNREDKLREELEEAWFALVVEKIAQQEGAELNALNEQLQKDPQYAVPEELDRRSMETIRKLVAQDKRRKTTKAAGRIFMRVACAAAIASLMLVSAYAVLPSARKRAVLNLLIETKDVSTRLVMEDVDRIKKDNGSETSEVETKVLLGYQIPEVPEDFKISDEKQSTNTAWIEYANDTGDTIRFRFYNGMSGSVEVDTEESGEKPIQINGINGRMWVKENSIKIAWSDPKTKTFITVTSEGIDPLSVEELAKKIQIAE